MMKADEELPIEDSSNRILIRVLRLSALLCFAGWTWDHLYWEGPYGVLLWHDFTYDLADRLGISWDEFVGTGAGDGWVQRWIAWIGWLYLACTVLTVTVRKRSNWQILALVGGSGLLGMIALLGLIFATMAL